MKNNKFDLIYKSVPLSFALIVFFVSLSRVLFVLHQPMEVLISCVPDDAFYYLKLAENYLRFGKWTFDSLNATTGFHLFYGYFLVLLNYIFDFTWNQLFCVISLISCACYAISSFIVSKCLEKLNAFPVIPLAQLPFISKIFMLQPSSLMETFLVIPLSALFIYWVIVLNYTKKINWILLFVCGILMSFARTDLGLFSFCFTIASLIVFGLKNDMTTKSMAGFFGCVSGLAVSMISNFLISGHLVQSSAAIKKYWSSIEGHSLIPSLNLLNSSVSFGFNSNLNKILKLIIFLIIGLAILKTIIYRKKKGLNNILFIYLGSFLVLISYVFLYIFNSTGLMFWYIGNILIAVSFCLSISVFVLTQNKYSYAYILIFFIILNSNIKFLFQIPFPNQKEMLKAAFYLKESEISGNIGAWNAGIISYFSKKNIINLDGLVNDSIVDYIISNNLLEYLKNNKIRYICDFEYMVNNSLIAKKHGFFSSKIKFKKQDINNSNKDENKTAKIYLYEIKFSKTEAKK